MEDLDSWIQDSQMRGKVEQKLVWRTSKRAWPKLMGRYLGNEGIAIRIEGPWAIGAVDLRVPVSLAKCR